MTAKKDAEASAQDRCVLRLYVAGYTAKSTLASANIKRICEIYMADGYEIEVIDLVKDPEYAARDQILAIPTLVRLLPPPVRRIIGDLSNTEKVMLVLDVQPKDGL